MQEEIQNKNPNPEELKTNYEKNAEQIFGKKNEQEKREQKKIEKLSLWSKLKAEFIKNPKEGIDLIAKHLKNQYHFKTIDGKRNDELYIFNKGVYTANKGKKIIKQEVENILNERASVHYIHEITEKIKRLTYIDVDKANFGNKNVNLVCLNNGILNIRTNELKPHDPDYIFLSKIPIDYKPGVDCPNIKQFFKDVLYSNDRPVLQEWFGYSLYQDYFIKKAIIFVGEAHGGKTTMLKLLTKFISPENIAGESLQKLTSDRFAAASLYQKYLNIYDDLSFDDINTTGAFKMATGGSYLTGEYKFGDRFQFVSFAKLIFATNKIPRTKNVDDDAYYGRWIVIRFDQTFGENNSKRDPHILDRLTKPEELSGLLNWTLEGLKRLLEKASFSYEKTPEQVKAIMQRSGSSLAAFVQDVIKVIDGAWISKEEFYEAFSKYTAENELSSITKEKVGRRLLSIEKRATERKIGNRTGWGNISLKKYQQPMSKGQNKALLQ